MQSKAAPRSELGIKDLQSSALPLGHAAIRGLSSPSGDRISESSRPLLVLSYGHGEVLFALRILDARHRLVPQWRLKVMPLVGEGRCFQQAVDQGWLQRIGPSARLPSGGFSNQSLRGLLADLVGGLPILSFKQWICLRQERTSVAGLLAVGDLLPLLMAWTCGRTLHSSAHPKAITPGAAAQARASATAITP